MRTAIVTVLTGSALAGALALATAAGAPAAHAAEYTLRLSHSLPVAHLRQKHATALETAIERVTDGAVDVKIFPAGQLYKSDEDAVNAVRSGAIEGAMVSPGALSLFEHGFELLELPFFFPSYRALDAALDGSVGKTLFEGLEDVGLKGLAYTDAGSSIIMNTQRPIEGVSDLQDLRIRASGGRIQLESFELLGASAIQLAFGDVAPGLQRGMIDGVYTTPAAAAAGNLGRTATYVTWTKQQFFAPAVIVNLAWFDGLPAEDQKAIMDAMPAFTEEARRLNQIEEASSISALKEQGAEIIEELSPEAIAAFKEKLTPLHEENREKIGGEIFDEAAAIAAEAD